MSDTINMGANPDVYQYLVDNYVSENTKIIVLDNGGYYLIGVHSNNSQRINNEIYVPPTIGTGEDIPLISYFPGGSGVQVDAEHWRQRCLSDNPPNAIVTMASYGNQSMFYVDQENDILEIGLKIANDNNSTVTDAVIQTFSESTNSCTKFTNNFVGNHPDINTTLILTDGSPDTYYVGDNLKKYNTPIIAIKNVNPGYNSKEMAYSTKAFDKIGYNIKVIETSHILDLDDHPEKEDIDYNDHYFANADATKSGLVELILGLRDDLDAEIMKKCNYKLYYYENDELVFINDWTDFSSIQHYNYTSKTHLQTLNENPYAEGTVGSDMYTITKLINNVRNNMNSDVLGMHENMSSTTIPNDFSKVQNSLFGISSDLNRNLYKETGLIAHIAQVFCDMDEERAAAAENLYNGENYSFKKSKYTNILNNLSRVNITSNITFDSFMFNPEKLTIGNGGKLCASDINAMLCGNSLIGPLHENLENERISAKNTKNEIDNMISTISFGSNFSGNVWTSVCDKLAKYGELMNTRIKSADILETAFVKALSLLKNYMEDYEVLDDSRVPELKSHAEKLKINIANLHQTVNATHYVKHEKIDIDGVKKIYLVREYYYSAQTRRNALEFINQAEKELVLIEKELAKLEGLPIILGQAEQIINDVLIDIYNDYGVKTGNIVVGKEVSYIPPTNTMYTPTVLPQPNHWKYQQDKPKSKLSLSEFYSNHELLMKYGSSYKDYLNGVEHTNNPIFNSSYKDNGITLNTSEFYNVLNEDESDADYIISEIPPIIEIPDDYKPSIYNNSNTNIFEIN